MTWLAGWLRRALPREFHFAEHIRERYEPWLTRAALGEPPLAGYLSATLEALAAAHPAEFLERACAELFCFPAASPLRPAEGDWSGPPWALKMAGDLVAQARLERHPAPYAIGLVADRARFILAHPFEGAELPEMALRDHPTRGYLSPTLKETLQALAAVREHPSALTPIRQIVAGAWDGPVPLNEEWAKRKPLAQGTRYQLFSGPLTESFPEFLELLHRRGLFEYGDLPALVRRLPHVMAGYYLEKHYDDATGFRAVQRDWTRRLVWETSASLSAESVAMLDSFCSWKLYGARWLFRACEHMAASGLRPTGEHCSGPERVIRFLAEIHGLAAEDQPAEVVERLRGFGPDVLETVLPLSRAARPLVLRALGWDAAEPLLGVMLRLGASEGGQESPIANSADPTSGVVDRQEIADCLAAAGPLAARLIGLFQASKVGPGPGVLTLVEAVAGTNRAAILKSLSRDAQTPLKAYGLLPLERGADEVLERYLRLKQVHRECRKYGLERQANTRAAVQAGLVNLAQTAGFPDLARLEWAMEARVAESHARPGRRVAVQAWDLELVVDGLEASLAVTKAGKRLATVPAALRKTDAYAEMQEAVEAWRAHRQRFRRAFEALMVEGAALGADDLDALRRLPVAGALLSRLVVRDETGFGTPDAAVRSLRGASGESRPIAAPLHVAHPEDLEAAGELGLWQGVIVRERMVQPFKQVFRERYLLTPAERQDGAFSTRFAGRELDARVAARLFQSREWQTVGDETRVLPFKPLRRAGLLALFELAGARYYLGADEVVTAGPIRFARRTPSWQWKREDVPLVEVPARTFSEVMRDADLVSSVAHRGGSDRWSPEAARLRADFVNALVSEMALPDVRVQGDVVEVRGRLASYRLHIGSAEVRVDPGDHPCILPQATAPPGEIYLPFADEDATCEEVVRKVLLLAGDHRIADEAVLARIRAAIARTP